MAAMPKSLLATFLLQSPKLDKLYIDHGHWSNGPCIHDTTEHQGGYLVTCLNRSTQVCVMVAVFFFVQKTPASVNRLKALKLIRSRMIITGLKGICCQNLWNLFFLASG